MEPLLNGVGAAIPEEVSYTFYTSNVWNVKTGQSDLWTGPKATLFGKMRRKQIL